MKRNPIFFIFIIISVICLTGCPVVTMMDLKNDSGKQIVVVNPGALDPGEYNIRIPIEPGESFRFGYQLTCLRVEVDGVLHIYNEMIPPDKYFNGIRLNTAFYVKAYFTDDNKLVLYNDVDDEKIELEKGCQNEFMK